MKRLILLWCIFCMFGAFGAKVVDKGHVVTEKGVLFTLSEEKELRKMKEQKIKLEQLRVLHEQKDIIQEERIKNLQDYANDFKPLRTYEKLLYFGLGILMTSGTLYLSAKLVKKIN